MLHYITRINIDEGMSEALKKIEENMTKSMNMDQCNQSLSKYAVL